MSTPIIRAATPADQDEIRALIFSILNEYDLDPDPKSIDRDLDDIEAFYQDGFFDVLVADDGVILGTVALKPNGDGIAELRKMYLKSKYRGRGYGKRLLKHAIASAKGLGINRVELETARVLEEAIGLYEKFGFVLTEERDVERRCDTVLVLHL